jgi:hypothetical protein
MPKKIVVRKWRVSVWVSAPMLRPGSLGAVRGPDMNLSVSYSHDSPLRSGHLLAALSTSPPVDVRYRNRPRDQVPVPGPPANVLRRFTVAKGPLLAFRGVARGRDSLAPPDQGINLMACLRRIAMTIPQVVRLVLATTSRGTRLTKCLPQTSVDLRQCRRARHQSVLPQRVQRRVGRVQMLVQVARIRVNI